MLPPQPHFLFLSQLQNRSTMKQKYNSVGLLLCLVFLLISTSARRLASKDGETNMEINSMSSSRKSVEETEYINDSLTNLMGLEECTQNEDEDCFKRRALVEAHLDYIYTQHHRP